MNLVSKENFCYSMSEIGYVVEKQAVAITANSSFYHVVIWTKKALIIKFRMLQNLDDHILNKIFSEISLLMSDIEITIKNEKFLNISVPLLDCVNSDLLNEFITRTEKVLKSYQFTQSDICPFCGESGCDSVAIVNEDASVVHALCANRESIKNEKSFSFSQNNLGVLLGILGAIIGMIVGSTINIVIEKYVFSTWLIVAIIPICIAFGFRLFSKEGGKIVAVTTLILSLVSVIVIHICSSYISSTSLSEGAFVGTFFEFLSFYFANFTAMIPSLASRVVSLIFGLFISWRFVLRKSYEREYAGYVSQSGLPAERVVIPLVTAKKSDLPEGYATFKKK